MFGLHIYLAGNATMAVVSDHGLGDVTSQQLGAAVQHFCTKILILFLTRADEKVLLAVSILYFSEYEVSRKGIRIGVYFKYGSRRF